jgi:predicted DNA-binding transcriptional regulator AlpA
MISKPMYAPEIAGRLGVGVDRFYKNRERYRMIDGMPQPISTIGRMAWDRAGMEAWLTRHDPRRPKIIANDAIAPPQPHADGEWNQFLHQHYGA